MSNILTNQEKEIIIKVLRYNAKVDDNSLLVELGAQRLAEIADRLESVKENKLSEQITNTTKSPVMQFDTMFYGVSLQNQLANIATWKEKYNLNKIPSQIKSPMEGELSVLENDLTAWVLVPYLNTLKETINFLWSVIKSNHDNSWKWSGLNNAKFKLHSGKFPKNTLKWVKIDLGAYHKDRSVEGVWKEAKEKGDTLAGVEVLAAAAHFPKWLQSQDGYKVPYTDIANIKVDVPGESRPHALCVYWRSGGRGAGLRADWVGHRGREWAAPVVRESLDA